MPIIYKRETKTGELTRTILEKFICDTCGKEVLSADHSLTDYPIEWYNLRKKYASYYDGYFSGIYCSTTCVQAALIDNTIPQANVSIINDKWHPTIIVNDS